MYFYENLFNPMENKKIINYNNLTKTKVQKLLNEPFSLNKDRKENIFKNFVNKI